MKSHTVPWAIALFFGCSIAFAAIRRLTEHQGRGVAVAAQFAALLLIVGAVILVVRRLERDKPDE